MKHIHLNIKWPYLVCLILAIILSCQKDEVVRPSAFPQLMEVPEGFPEIPAPPDNTFTVERWELGKKLFFDPIMSRDSSISCASCHQVEFAFSDNHRVSEGVDGNAGVRNAPTLTNVAYHPYFTREGGTATLEMQIQIPIQEHDEFDFNILQIAERMSADETYVEMAQLAYGRLPDAFVITRALSCFERSLISGNSRFDKYYYQGDLHMLTDLERKGMSIFFGEQGKCSHCHNGFNFTNYAFENNGLYESYVDNGRFRLTQLEEDLARFKVPTLRNIDLTAPYMHDGRISTLEKVIEHYVTGGKTHPNKNPILEPLSLSKEDQEALLAFLKSLTDETFVNNPIFQ